MDAPEKPKKDGRLLRAERSRDAVAGAMLELLREGVPAPTAAQVAERAGVSLRLVFHHFEDMEAVYRAAFRVQSRVIGPLVDPQVTAAAPLERRVSTIVRRRAALYEQIAPVRRAALANVARSPTLAEILAAFRETKRAQAVALFETELSRFQPAERRERAAALGLSLSFSAWDALSAHQGLSEKEVRSVMRRSVRVIVGAGE